MSQIQAPFWLKNIPSATGATTSNLYDRWKETASPTRHSFVADILRNYMKRAACTVRTLFPYDQEPFSSVYRETPLQGKYLVNAKNVVHVKASVDEEALALGDKVFHTINQENQDLIMCRLTMTSIGAPVVYQSHYAAYVTPYQAGRHPHSTPGDLFAVGKGLGKLQAAFNTLPRRLNCAIKESSQTEIKRFSSGALYLLDHAHDFSSEYPNEANAVLNTAESFIVADQKSWMPSHMNMILGDIMLDANNNVIILDNERIAGGWMPEGLDIGTAVTRIALEALLPDGTEPRATVEHVKPLLEGYNTTSPSPKTMKGLLKTAVSSLAVEKVFSVASQLAGHTGPQPDAPHKFQKHMATIAKPIQLLRELG